MRWSYLTDRVKRINREALRRRRRLLIFAGIVLLLLLLVGGAVVASYLSSYYLLRYPSLKSYHRAWMTSTHAEVNCLRCHMPPGRKSAVLFQARMLGEFYGGWMLGRRKPPFSRPGDRACLECHVITRTASPSGDLKIPHLAHVKVLKLKCVSCHEWVVHRKNPEQKHTPRMVLCLTCHDGEKASRECIDCHKKKSFPVSHRAPDWLMVHKEKKEKKEENCEGCHGWVKNYCQNCHSRKPSSHAGWWRTLHQLRVTAHRNCEACHQQPFCERCHGEAP